MIRNWLSAHAQRRITLRCAVLFSIFAAATLVPAQTITIRILDGKTGGPIAPTNLLIRVDRRDEFHNTGLTLNGREPAVAILPSGAKLLSVEGAYDNSTEVYINCDADTGKDGGELKWYSIKDIMTAGVVTPDLCFKGKYAPRLHVVAKPGEFVFFVRAIGLRDQLPR